jgi:hypothetical protein
MKTKTLISTLFLLSVISVVSFYGFNLTDNSGTAERNCVGFGVLLLNNNVDCRTTVTVTCVSSGNTYTLNGGYGGNPNMFYGCPPEYGIFNVKACSCNTHGSANNVSFYSPSGAYVEINMLNGQCLPDQ